MLVVANWKMNGSAAFVRRWLAEWESERESEAGGIPAAVTAVVCPPFPFLGMLAEAGAVGFSLGGQDCSGAESESGARTGEVSAAMLAEWGCEYVLVGHSERRRFWGEDGAMCGAKMQSALAAGLTPILCVGETAEERARGETAQTARRQLGEALECLRRGGISPQNGVVVGYEPVWAIGSGQVPSVGEIAEAHGAIRDFLRESGFGGRGCGIIRVIYGGSVGAANAADIFAAAGVDGALVGGASLRAADFARICRAAGMKTPTPTHP